MKLRALLVDDESPARKELRYLLQEYTDLQVIGEAANAIEALELINNLDYSVVFLDIDMPGLKGIDLASQIKDKEHAPAIIFITAHEEFAVEAFCVNALDYLLKPINSKRLNQAINKLYIYNNTLTSTPSAPTPSTVDVAEPSPVTPPSNPKASSENGTSRPLEVIPVEQRGKTILLRPEEIIYIFTDKDNVFAKTQKESYLTRFTLRELEARLNPNLFFRTHRCYLVNIQRMRELIPYFNGTYSIVVDDNERSEVPVSRTQSRKLKEILGL